MILIKARSNHVLGQLHCNHNSRMANYGDDFETSDELQATIPSVCIDTRNYYWPNYTPVDVHHDVPVSPAADSGLIIMWLHSRSLWKQTFIDASEPQHTFHLTLLKVVIPIETITDPYCHVPP